MNKASSFSLYMDFKCWGFASVRIQCVEMMCLGDLVDFSMDILLPPPLPPIACFYGFVSFSRLHCSAPFWVTFLSHYHLNFQLEITLVHQGHFCVWVAVLRDSFQNLRQTTLFVWPYVDHKSESAFIGDETFKDEAETTVTTAHLSVHTCSASLLPPQYNITLFHFQSWHCGGGIAANRSWM